MEPEPNFLHGAGAEKKLSEAGAEEKWFGSATLVVSTVACQSGQLWTVSKGSLFYFTFKPTNPGVYVLHSMNFLFGFYIPVFGTLLRELRLAG